MSTEYAMKRKQTRRVDDRFSAARVKHKTPIWFTYACVNLEAFKSIHLNADVLH